MKTKLSLFSIIGALALLVVACDKYETLPAPPLNAGDCQYQQAGLSQSIAQSEMDRIAAILEDATLGSHAVAVKSKNTYVSDTKNGQPYRWGFQVIFSCDGAEIKFERSGYYDYQADAVRDMNIRVDGLKTGKLTKVLSYSSHSRSWEECDTCCGSFCDTCYDDDGEAYDCNCSDECWDCNCKTYYEYYYQITYMIVNPNNLRQSAFSQAFLAFQNTLPDKSTGERPNVSDTLKAAKQVVPAFTQEGRMVRDWLHLLNAVDSKKGLPQKKACSDRALKKLKGDERNASVMPNSRHLVLPSSSKLKK
jgi:hypothetical protein